MRIEYITSYKFARIADFVFSEVLTKEQFNELNPEKIDIIKKLLNKFSLTDTVEIVHKIADIGKKELYKKALDIQNEK